MRGSRLIFTLLIAATLLYVGFLGLLSVFQGSFIYPGTKNRVEARLPLTDGAEIFRVATALGNVEAVFLPATLITPGEKQPVLIFAHGNGEVIDALLSALDGFRQRGMGVLLVEYPGYGRSTGRPSEAAIRGVLAAAYDRVVKDPRVDSARMVGFGQSLGGGAICQLARDRPLRALILQSTFPSLDIFTSRYAAPAFLLRDHFDNLSVVLQFQGPLLVIH